jgi:hypothetical protein
MYLRFTTKAIHVDSKKPRGLFAEAYDLLDSGDLSSLERKQLREILTWFNINLPHPPKKFSANRAIFWFKSDAQECIGKIWEIVHLLRAHDKHVVVQKCRRLANVIYSDKLQVAAFPSDLDDRIIEH